MAQFKLWLSDRAWRSGLRTVAPRPLIVLWMTADELERAAIAVGGGVALVSASRARDRNAPGRRVCPEAHRQLPGHGPVFCASTAARDGRIGLSGGGYNNV
jgi:hypothetical protein